MAQWTLVRHGESVANADDKLAGHVDTPLTDKGIQQARALAESLATASFGRAVCSTLSRAHHTARILLEPHDLPLVAVDDLRERHMGTWAGRTRSTLKGTTAWNDALLTWHGRPPGGESQSDVAKRAVAWLANTEDGSDTLLVAHGGVLRALLGLLDNEPPGTIPDRVIGNCEQVKRELGTGRWAEILMTIRARQ